jgi:hypothetical protein
MATQEYLLGNVAVRGATGATGATGPTGASAFQTVTIQPAPAGGFTEMEINLGSLVPDIIGAVVIFRLETTMPGDVLWSQIFHMGTGITGPNILYVKSASGNDKRMLAQVGDVSNIIGGPGLRVVLSGAPAGADAVSVSPGSGQWGLHIISYIQSTLLFSVKSL